MKNSKIKPTTVRILFILIIFILLGSGISGFYFTQDYLNKLATDISNTPIEITPQEPTTIDIKNLQKQINDNKDIIEKMSSIFYSKQNYKDQVSQDIDKYASAYGITISDYSTTQGEGLESSGIVTITLNNPIKYDSFINFLKAIETNNPKMQPTNVRISLANEGSGDILVESLSIKVDLK